MKRYLLLFFLILFSHWVFSQTYNNNWINYSRPYFKIPVTKEGIYRISVPVLASAGFPLNGSSPANVQLFCKGQEQYIYFSGSNPYVFNNNDYFEFYAKGNDGWFDAELYDNPADITNPFYSMFTDTMYYFLTYNGSLNNLRVSNETDINFPAYAGNKPPYCVVDVNYQNPTQFYNIKSGPRFEAGDGWYSPYFDAISPTNNSDDRTLSTPGFVPGYDPTYINVSVSSYSNASAPGENHHLRITYPNMIFDSLFSDYRVIKKHFATSATLSSSTTIGVRGINDLNTVTDKMALISISLTYCRNFVFQGAYRQAFRVNDASGSKALIEVEQFGSSNAILWDLTNHRRIPVVSESGKLKAIIPNNGNLKSCFISSIDSIYQVTTLYKKTYTDYSVSGANSDYIIITHPSLMYSANLYKSYRDHKYKAYCYDIEQLYDQFAYGIKKHPLAIRNFLGYISATYDSVPKFVLIIGKGIHCATNKYDESFRKNNLNFTNCLVPSFGAPSSDNLLATKILLSGNGKTQDIPIGRIAATTDTEVEKYLAKVIEHEELQPAEWMKNVIHFGGGTTAAEQNEFKNYLSADSAIIADTLFGAYVQTFLKTTSLPIQISVSSLVQSLINNGVSIITFFGHGNTSGFDQNIQNPDFYQNSGKYPLLIANSCLAGDIHLPNKNISENWILDAPDKGAIGFFASVDLGYATYLHFFSNELYKQLAYKNYAQPIGKCIMESSKELILYQGLNSYMINTCLDFTLHGDPAVCLKNFASPDLTINSGSIGFVPEFVTSDVDSFEVRVVVTNIGKATNESYMVSINRTFPDGGTETYSKIFTGCYFKDTVYIKVPTNFIRGPGVNQICVTVDSENWIAEMSEANNSACTNLTIQTNDLIPVYPYEYAIYPNPAVTLKASTGYPFVGTQTFQFQIDTTTDIFPVNPMASGTVIQSGGVVTWTPPITLQDSTVYFWRVSSVPQGSDTVKWKESSFTYIPDKTGWSQAHFFQFKKDGFENINYKRNGRFLEFVTAPKGLHCTTIGNAGGTPEWYATKYSIDAIGEGSSCGATPAMLVVVIDPLTMLPWESSFERAFGQNNWPVSPTSPSCPGKSRLDKYFIFYTDSLHLENLGIMLNTFVPDSFYILVYTFMHGNFNLWSNSTKAAFLSLGASQFLSYSAQNHNNYPYIFFCKKGDPFSAEEVIADSSRHILDFDKLLPTNFISGSVRSTMIGPSSQWQTLHWKQASLENPTKDYVNLNLTGYRPNNDSSLVIPSISVDSTTINDLYNYADATQFPYLRLRMNTVDDSLKTPSQLKKWQITYQEAPETAINPTRGYLFIKDTLQEGENLTFSVATENISVYNMDSMLVKYWVQDKNNHIVNVTYKKLRTHPTGDILRDTITISTIGLPGLNHIWYEVNPVDTNTGTYNQLEQYHFNNFAEKPFYVSSDITNPLLDVTFDGVHIMNGDIVSAKPVILTSLKDENKFLALDDTSSFGVYLTNLSTGVENRIFFCDPPCPEISFTKAQLPNNSCKIEYRPILSDGKYQLRIQAKDKSNNESGNIDYKINFEVINRSTITNLFNYPNPFSTSTRFVFTLTGSEIPDDFRIQIITITGKFVREIHLEELGPLHIGNNITQFAWDGTDTYGDKLANGVYFFKVIAKLHDEAIEKRSTDADKYFKEGFGKMYILR